MNIDQLIDVGIDSEIVELLASFKEAESIYEQLDLALMAGYRLAVIEVTVRLLKPGQMATWVNFAVTSSNEVNHMAICRHGLELLNT